MEENRLQRIDVVCMAAVALLAVTSYFRADNPAASVVSRKFRSEIRHSVRVPFQEVPRR